MHIQDLWLCVKFDSMHIQDYDCVKFDSMYIQAIYTPLLPPDYV